MADTRKQLSLLTLLLLMSSAAMGQGACESFVPGALDATAIRQQFSGAVLRIGSTGTGYLIDSSGGYVLTAAHVVSPMVDQGIPVVATSPSKEDTLELSVVQVLEPQDLALLQVKNPEIASNIQPLDISFHLPDESINLVAMGYPKVGDENNRSLKVFDAKFTELTTSGLIEVDQRTYYGNSGGPLVDRTGSVVGTCEQEAGGNNLARYSPSANAKPLLERIPLSSRMKMIDKRFRDGTLPRPELVQLLLKRPGGPSNVELYLWMKHISASKISYSKLKEFLTCPLLSALADRNMLDAIQFFVSQADPAIISKVSLELGKREARLGKAAAALQNSRIALDAFSKLGDTKGQAEAELLIGNILEQSGAYDSALARYQEALDNVNATAWYDLHAQTLIHLGSVDSKRGDYKAAAANYELALPLLQKQGRDKQVAATFVDLAAIKVHQSLYQSAMDYISKALHIYSKKPDKPAEASTWYLLGNIQLQTNDVKAARNSFSEALRLDPAGKNSSDITTVLNTLGGTLEE
ncbi:MAG: serine protease [Acidobacteriia bacterium]|nr:serine protease [Terriglobia bacterium]